MLFKPTVITAFAATFLGTAMADEAGAACNRHDANVVARAPIPVAYDDPRPVELPTTTIRQTITEDRTVTLILTGGSTVTVTPCASTTSAILNATIPATTESAIVSPTESITGLVTAESATSALSTTTLNQSVVSTHTITLTSGTFVQTTLVAVTGIATVTGTYNGTTNSTIDPSLSSTVSPSVSSTFTEFTTVTGTESTTTHTGAAPPLSTVPTTGGARSSGLYDVTKLSTAMLGVLAAVMFIIA